MKEIMFFSKIWDFGSGDRLIYHPKILTLIHQGFTAENTERRKYDWIRFCALAALMCSCGFSLCVIGWL